LNKRNGTRAFSVKIFNVAPFSNVQVATVVSFGELDLAGND